MGGKGSGRKGSGLTRLVLRKIKPAFRLHRPKLTDEEFEELKRLRAEGLTQKAIAIRMNLCQSTVCEYLMPAEKRAEMQRNRNESHNRWRKAHKGEPYRRIMKRKRFLEKVGGLEEVQEDWTRGVKIYVNK